MSPTSAASGEGIAGRILIVDDDEQLCHVLADTLKEYGYDPTYVQNAEEAYLQATSNPPHLILLDVEIPQMGGLALCQKLRAAGPTQKTPILFLTVRDSAFDRQAALALGANQYLTKPFQKDLLLKSISENGVPIKKVVRGSILIVDDDLELCQVIADTLKDKGYETSFVQTAEEGLERGVSNPPNLFLLDLEVPRMGGFVLCQKLRATPETKSIPIIFLTVRDSDFDRQTAFNLGANQYITKPFRRSVLLKEVETQIASSQSNQKEDDWVRPSMGQGTLKVAPSAILAEETVSETSSKSQPTISHPTTPTAPPSIPVPKPVTPPPPVSQVPESVSSPKVPLPVTTPETKSSPPIQTPQPVSASSKPSVSTSAGTLKTAVPPASAGSKVSPIKSQAKPASSYYKEWILKNKYLAIGMGTLLIGGLTWGSILLYKHFVTPKKKAEETPAASQQQSEVSVNVMQAAAAPFQDILNAVGTVAGGAEIELRFQTEGNIHSMSFNEGDSVRAGQVIALLDQSQASIKLERAKSEYYRYEKLYALGGVSKDRLEEARVQFEFAQTEMAKTVLRASQDGIFGDKGVEVGEFVTPQKKVGTLVSLNTVLIRIGVIEKEIDKIFPGQLVTATVETYPNVEFKGKVENISPLVQGQSKTLMVEARVPNTGKLLLPGMFARTKIVIYEKDNVISVPNDALEKTQEGYKIYIVGKENKAEVRPVQVSYVSLTHSVISNGLQPGDQVIIQRPQELKEGSPLKVVEVEKAASTLEGQNPTGAEGGGPSGPGGDESSKP